MAYWLLKADPETYGLADLERDRKTTWDGVANALALGHLWKMKKDDEALVYHSGAEKSVVGVAKVIRNPSADPKSKDPKRGVVDLAFVRRFAFPVPLAAVKADPSFAKFELVRMPRLSVMPVPATLWKQIVKMAGEG